MALIEWNTPLVNPVDTLRKLQDAANSLDYHEFTAAMHWPEDEYAEAKFRHFQEIGRLLSYFDNGVLLKALEAYDAQTLIRALKRGDTVHIRADAELASLLDPEIEEELRYGTDRCAWPRCWTLRANHEGLDHNFAEASTGDDHSLDSCNRCGAWRMYHEPGHPDHDAADACEDFEEPGS